MSKPIIGITMGDAAGIGPEVILKALAAPEIRKSITPLIIGEDFVFEKIKKIIHFPFKKPNFLNLGAIGESDFEVGRVNKSCGKAAIAYVKKAFFLARSGKIDAFVTAPINKEAVKLSGFPYPGHTEFLAALSKRKRFGMLLAAKELKVLLVTTHLALREVSAALTKEKILEKIKLGYHFLKDNLEFKNPRIAVSGLNPHNGENGAFGDEEKKVIAPAIAAARKVGINCSGPVVPDTLFYRTVKQKKYDLAVVMYHDQGLIPLKTLYFREGVNITIGLPIIRTSPDHGTAFDIAGQGKADPTSMKEAIKYAARLVSGRRNKNSAQEVSL